jgi:hypothetical protein
MVDESSLLARLFRRAVPEPVADADDKLDLAEFDALLQESTADRELRRKLSAGISGRVA